MKMEWSAQTATNAYLDTLKLCSKHKEQGNFLEAKESQSNIEFISALAAGMNSKLIVELASEVSTSTVALAAAARQTGGKLVCIIPEPMLDTSQKLVEDSGLNDMDMVELKIGDPVDLLSNYENIDFSLVDCKSEDYPRLLSMLDVNHKRSAVVVANNLVEGRNGLGASVKGMESKEKVVRSMKHIGKGMEVTMIGKSGELGRKEKGKVGRSCRGDRKSTGVGKKSDKSKWVFKYDEKSGEEHIFRVPRNHRPL